MWLLSFLFSLIGLLFTLRILAKFRARALISQTLLTKIGTIICVFIILGAILSPFATIRSLALLFVFTALLLVSLWRAEKNQIAQLRCEVGPFIDRWIIHLRLGKALSSARDAALRDSSEKFFALMQPLLTSTAHMGLKHLFVEATMLSELQSLQKSGHLALERLTTIRDLMRRSDSFRRKSGQAVRQASIQAGILLCLQFALSVFTIHRYGWKNSGDLVVISALFSLCGAWLMRQTSRKTTWKV